MSGGAGVGNRVAELRRAGKFSDAMPLAQRALAIGENALGPDHPEVAGSFNNLTALYSNQARYATDLTCAVAQLDAPRLRHRIAVCRVCHRGFTFFRKSLSS
jgi:hypothetical protein